MAITTYTTFLAAITGLTVTGVERSLAYPPRSIRKGDMPLMFPNLPSGIENRWALGAAGGWPQMRCELVIILYPSTMELDDARYSETVTMMDSLSTALRALETGRAPIQWAIRYDVIVAADATYHAVVADIETAG